MTISVIIPAYNTADYLDRTLRNIAEEQFDDSPAELWEIIVVNDGSTDRTEAIAQEWAGRYPGNIRVISQPNQGVSAARNRGIDEARGEYVYFMDSDDLLRQRALPDLVHSATAARLDMLAFYYTETDSRQYSLYSSAAPAHLPLPSAAPLTAHQYLTLTDGMRGINMLGAVWRAIYRKSFITGHDLRFDTRMMFGEDSVFNLNLLFANPRMAMVPQKLYFYNNRRGDNATRNTNLRHLTRIADSMEIYIQELSFLKHTVRRNLDIPGSILRYLNESINYAYQLTAANRIALGAPMRELLRLRRIFKDAGGKASPGRPRFTEKDRKYTLLQHIRRWILAYPVMGVAGACDRLRGRGLWQSREVIEDQNLIKKEHSTAAKDKVLESLPCGDKRILIMTGGYQTDSEEAKAIDSYIKNKGPRGSQIIVAAPELSIESIEQIVAKGLFPFEYGTINDRTIQTESDLISMAGYMAAAQNIDEICVTPSAGIPDIPSTIGKCKTIHLNTSCT